MAFATFVIDQSKFTPSNTETGMRMTPSPTSSNTNIESKATSRLVRLEGYLRADPDNLSLLQDAARAAMSEGKLERASEFVTRARSFSSDEHWDSVRHLEAHLLLAKREYATAAEQLDQLWKKHQNPVLFADYLFALMGLHRYTEVVKAVDEFFASGSAFPPVSFHYVRALHHLGEMERAIAHLDHAAESGAMPEELLGAASLAYFDANRLKDAAHYAKLALTLNPDYYEAVLVEASMQLAEGNSAAAKVGFEHAERLHGNGGRSQAGLGMVAMLGGDLVSAKAHMASAANIMSNHVGSWVGLAWVSILLSDLVAARSAVERAMSLNPRFAEVHGVLAVVEALSADRAEAEKAMTRARRLDPNSFSVQYAQMVLSGNHRDAAAVQAAASQIVARLGLARPPRF